MKKKYFILTLLIITAASCKKQGSDSEVVTDSTTVTKVAKETADSNFAKSIKIYEGEYQTETDPINFLGLLTFSEPADSSFKFSISLSSEEGDCHKNINGVATFVSLTEAISFPVKGCKLTFTILDEVNVKVTSTSCNDGEAPCNFNQMFVKKVLSKPEDAVSEGNNEGVFVIENGEEFELVPIKMAYEVKWSKTKTTDVFFVSETLQDGGALLTSEKTNADGSPNKCTLYFNEKFTEGFVNFGNGSKDLNFKIRLKQ